LPVTSSDEVADPEDMAACDASGRHRRLQRRDRKLAPPQPARATVGELTLPEGRGYAEFAAEAAESRDSAQALPRQGWTIEQSTSRLLAVRLRNMGRQVRARQGRTS